MRSSEAALVAALAVGLCAAPAGAQQAAQGFALERLYPSAPGGGWFVMDDLDLRGGLGGAIALTGGYAYRPLRLAQPGGGHFSLVSDEAFADVAAAITYDRYRLYADFAGPLVLAGTDGAVGDVTYTAPGVDIGTNPDTFWDLRVGFDARIYGEPRGPFRLGAGAQVYFPSGERSEYISDHTYRAMVRVLAAGDEGWFRYAAQLGVHIRPLDEPSIPGNPQGTELLFGAAAGAAFPMDDSWTFIVGPEVYGETAFRALFGEPTGVEALLSARMERRNPWTAGLRFKLGAGGGIDPSFGAPAFRTVLSVEVFGRTTL
jgi:hypothetical protein